MCKIKIFTKKLTSIVLVMSLLFSLFPATIVIASPAQTLRVAVLSEPRIFPQSMISNSPAFNEIVRSDIAMLSESQAILDAAISEIIAQAPDVLLVPGNLTKDGEVASHEFLAGRLNQVRAALPDISIYVINGSRDINNPNAYSFAGGVPVAVASATPELFRSIYAGLGYGEAANEYFVPSSGQVGSNSYVARPSPGFTVIAIDTASGAGSAQQNSGSIGPELLNWITQQAQAAETRGDTVIAFMHHSLIPHSSIQSTLFPDTLVQQHEYIGAAFAEAGIRYVFTGAMRSNNIAQVTVNGNTLTDISTASLTAFPSPIRYAAFTRGVNEANRMFETVDISTQPIGSAINYINPQTGQNITNLTEYGSRMVTSQVIFSLIMNTGLSELIHGALDEMEATEFVNTRGIRHTGLRAILESALPIVDEAGNPISNDLGDFLIDVLRETLPDNAADAIVIEIEDVTGIRLFYERNPGRIRMQFPGSDFLAGSIFITDANLRAHLVNPVFTQLNNNLLVDRTIVNNVIDQMIHDLLYMNIYPLPQPDGEGGYTSAGDQYTLFDLFQYTYLAHLAGDEQAEQWMLDVIESLSNEGPLLDLAIDIVMSNLAVAFDDALSNLTINTSGLLTASGLLAITTRLVLVSLLGNNLGSIMDFMGLDIIELVGDLGDLLPVELQAELGSMLANTSLALLVNYGYPNDNFTTLHWVGDEINGPVDGTALRIEIASTYTVRHGSNHIGDPLTNIRPGDEIFYMVFVRAHRSNAETSYDTHIYMCFPDFLDITQMVTQTPFREENGKVIFYVGDLAPEDEVMVAFVATATDDAIETIQSNLIRYFSTNREMGISSTYTIRHGSNHIGDPLTNIRPGDEIFYMFFVIAYEDVIDARVYMCFPDFLEITMMVIGDLYSVGDGVAIFCMGNLEEGQEVMVAFVATATDNAIETVQSNLIRYFSYTYTLN